MALVYCEICGVLIKGQQEQEVPEGVICDGCFASRRAVVSEAPAPPSDEAMVQFNCCYCRSLLRLRAVGKRTRIKCPKCNDHFYLNPDGRLESRLEGNTTAVFAADVSLNPLTPQGGTSPLDTPTNKTQPLRRDAVAGLSKTQPMSREAIGQHALLEELKPKKLEFLDDVPGRGKDDAATVDTAGYDSPKLDLAPEPGARRADPPTAVLRPSEEGRIDFDADGLRRKTAKYEQSKLTGGAGGKVTTKKLKRPDPPPPEDASAPRADKAEKEARREERERRAAEAAKKAQELVASDEKQRLGTLALTAVSLLPALLAVLILPMTLRGTGFATRGEVGAQLERLGGAVDRGARGLGKLVNPHLPPELRLPE